MYEYKIYPIPYSTKANKRPNIHMDAEYITVHSTANTKSTAQNERDWLVNPNNIRQASWHICVDENKAIEAIPLDEVAWHAGDGKNGTGNRKSISIEVCESGDRVKTVMNATKLIAKMLHERGWGVDRVRKHQDWTGKYCPRILIPQWDRFIIDIQSELDNLNKPTEPKVPQWKYAGVNYLHDTKILNDNKYWKEHINEPMPVWAVTILISQAIQHIKSELMK